MLMKYFIAITVLLFAATGLADDTYGLFMVVKGDVKVTLAKDKSEVPAKVGMKVNSGDSISAGADSRAKVVMSDKNVLNISPDSKIVIEKYENDGKDKKNVELSVLYGKVRASVEQKYDGEKNKFNIKTPTAVAGVRGTDFLTSFNRETKVSQIVTFKGVVAVGQPGPGGSILNPVFVKKGETTSAKEGQKPEAPKAMPKEELNSSNNESNADVKQPDKKDDAAPAEKKEDKKDEKKDEAKVDEAKPDAVADKKEESKKEEPKKDDKSADSTDKKAEPKQEAKQDQAPADKSPSKADRAPANEQSGGSSGPSMIGTNEQVIDVTPKVVEGTKTTTNPVVYVPISSVPKSVPTPIPTPPPQVKTKSSVNIIIKPK